MIPFKAPTEFGLHLIEIARKHPDIIWAEALTWDDVEAVLDRMSLRRKGDKPPLPTLEELQTHYGSAISKALYALVEDWRDVIEDIINDAARDNQEGEAA